MFSRPPVLAPALLVVLLVLAGCTGGGTKGANEAPGARFTVKPGATPNAFQFDASSSTDADGDALEYWWNFGDGSDPIEGKLVEYEFAVTDTRFAASLVVRDDRGLAGVALQEVVLGKGRNAAPEAQLGTSNRWVKPGQAVTLDASLTHDGDSDPLGFEWAFGPRVEASEKVAALKNACAESSTNPFVFSTGCLGTGEAFNLTIDQPGTYNYHCHPHPWMKARLVVAADAEISGSHQVDIENFDYSEGVIRVKPGTTVVFANQDPVPHTATVEYFSPGESRSTTPVLQVSPEPGDYVARLYVNDFKGGLVSATWGVRVGESAPPNPDRRTFQKALTTAPQTSLQLAENWYNITFQTRIDATLDLNTSAEQIQGELSIVRINDNNNPLAVDQCVAAAIPMETGKLNMACTIDTGKYKFRVAAKEGSVLAEWTLTVLGYPYAKPDFGDSTGGGHHH